MLPSITDHQTKITDQGLVFHGHGSFSNSGATQKRPACCQEMSNGIKDMRKISREYNSFSEIHATPNPADRGTWHGCPFLRVESGLPGLSSPGGPSSPGLIIDPTLGYTTVQSETVFREVFDDPIGWSP